jgi:ABC-type spermidine/putrescine transport system permease subunit II
MGPKMGLKGLMQGVFYAPLMGHTIRASVCLSFLLCNVRNVHTLRQNVGANSVGCTAYVMSYSQT